MSHYYEVACAGFDGSTDGTDHRLLWVLSPDLGTVEDAVAGLGASVVELPFMPAPLDVDFVLPMGKVELKALVLHLRCAK